MVWVWWQRKTVQPVKNGGKLRQYIINGLEPVSVIDHSTFTPGNRSCLLDKVQSYIIIIFIVIFIIIIIIVMIYCRYYFIFTIICISSLWLMLLLPLSVSSDSSLGV